MATFFAITLHFVLTTSLFFLHHGCANALSFRISHFDENSVNYHGDAIPLAGAFELINKLKSRYRVGWATSHQKFPLYDFKSGRVSNFTTRFSFTVVTQGSEYGHGLTFFLAPLGFQIPPNSGAGYLGLFNTTTMASSWNQIVAVEFDTYSDSWDPPGEHVGINVNSLTSAVTVPWNAGNHSGDIVDVWVSYDASDKNMSVRWSYGNTARESVTSLSYKVDLKAILPQWVMLGFTGTTGVIRQRTVIRSWEFSSDLEVKEDDGKNSRTVKLIVGLTVSGGLLLTMLFGFWMLKRIKKNKSVAKSTDAALINDDDLERGAGPRRFSYRDLSSATNNFSDERKLGQGGFGAVYRGYLPDLDAFVAVKRISRGSRQGEKEYLTEVKIISQLRHRNLVQLIGWCHEKAELLLVYEFMPNRSLDSHLFDKRISPLNWGMRRKISLGLASALLYLHEEWEQCVVHRDVKSSNIMLDSSFNVKLGDFGLARLMNHELEPQTTGLAGTLGYLAPEYISTGKASRESDVYSFGVVCLEIATGRKAMHPMGEDSETGLVEWVWDLYGKRKLVNGVDERLKKDFEEKQIECLMIVGLWCAHPDRALRPSIRQAISVLNLEAAWPNLPASIPVAVYRAPTTPSVSSGEPLISTSLEVGR